MVDPCPGAVRDRVAPATVEDITDWLRARSDEFRRGNDQGLLILLGPASGYAGIAIVNTLLVGSLRRQREFVAARLLGATPSQMRQLIVWESALVGLAALSIAGGIALAIALLTRRAMMAGLDPATMTVPWLTLGAIAVTCAGLAVVAALAGAARVLRDAHPSAAVE